MSKPILRLSLLSASLLFASAAVSAAGFQLNEQSVVSLGRAHAGMGVVGDDLSAAFYNPAGMSLLNGTQAQLGVIAAFVDVDFNGTDTRSSMVKTENQSGSGNSNVAVAIPNAYLVHQVNDRLRLGMAITAPFGLKMDYDDNWIGKNHGSYASIEAIDFNPSLAYQLNEQWSVGAGVSAQYTKADLKQSKDFSPFNGIPQVDTSKTNGEVTADGWAYGWNAGVMYSPSKDTHIGLAYRSQIKHSVSGNVTVSGVPSGLVSDAVKNGVFSANSDVTLPETVTLSAYSKIDPKWGISAAARWTKWSRLQEIRVKTGLGDDLTLPQNWGNSVFFSLGADYYHSDQWTFRGGLGYETTPIKQDADRTPIIPDSDRIWTSLGASYHVNKQLTIDMAYAHLFASGSRKVDHTVSQQALGMTFTDRLQGEYRTNANLLGVQLQYRF
ncbi:outer membrane protein transport protein [Neisseriaceae bacterium JH1-16]|nr:outer membrane protein transport protein [Neisseriaceae bacterium JH1-16]